MNTVPETEQSQRTKPNCRTISRADNMRALIAKLELCDMTLDMICAALEMSASGGRKYRAELLRRGVIEPVGNAGSRHAIRPCHPIYRLSDEAAKEQFLAELKEPPLRKEYTRKMPEPIPGRTIHTMRDDQYYLVKRPDVVVRRNEFDALLFGPAPAREAV